MRSRGTLRPLRTFSRNGITSSRFSGPPKESTSTASYNCSAIKPIVAQPFLAVFSSASAHGCTASDLRDAPTGPAPKPHQLAADGPIFHPPTSSDCRADPKIHPSTHTPDRGQNRTRPQLEALAAP